jgi:hypothetical protein
MGSRHEGDLMNAVVRRFRLPESHAAYLRWCEVTGLDESTTAWGEVWQVLDQCGLLEADTMPQQRLFDPPGEQPLLRALRLALLGGAYYSTAEGVDPATATAVVSALMAAEFTGLGLSFEQELTLLRREVPRMVVEVVDTPSQALLRPVRLAVEEMYGAAGGQAEKVNDLVLQILDAATHDDAFARRVFRRLASDVRWRVNLIGLCHGQWLVYRREE